MAEKDQLEASDPLHEALMAAGGAELDADALVAAAQEAIRRGELPAAGTLLHTALLTDPRHAGAWSLRGAVHEAQGQLPEAKRAYRQALSLVDQDASTTVALAALSARTGDEDEARSLLAWLLLEEDVPEAERQRAAELLRALGPKEAGA